MQPANVLERAGIDGNEALNALELEDGETMRRQIGNYCERSVLRDSYVNIDW